MEIPNIEKSSDMVYLGFLLADLDKTTEFWREVAKKHPKKLPQLYILADIIKNTKV